LLLEAGGVELTYELLFKSNSGLGGGSWRTLRVAKGRDLMWTIKRN